MKDNDLGYDFGREFSLVNSSYEIEPFKIKVFLVIYSGRQNYSRCCGTVSLLKLQFYHCAVHLQIVESPKVFCQKYKDHLLHNLSCCPHKAD